MITWSVAKVQPFEYLVALLGGNSIETIISDIGGRELLAEAIKVRLVVVAVISLVVLKQECLMLGCAGRDVDFVEERFPSNFKVKIHHHEILKTTKECET